MKRSIDNFLNLEKGSPIQGLQNLPIGVTKHAEDGAIEISDSDVNGTYLTYGAEFDSNFQNEKELMEKYEEMELDPYIRDAVTDIVDDCVIMDEDQDVVRLNLEKIDSPFVNDRVKKLFQEEFSYLLNLLDFNNEGYEIFKDWYFKGKQYHFISIAEDGKSIKDIYRLDQKNVQKVRKINQKKVQNTEKQIVNVIDDPEEYYLYKLNDREDSQKFKSYYLNTEQAVKFPHDSIIHIHSGVYDRKNNLILSEMHPAIRTYNQLRQTEDASVIWRLVRAPQKRVFYIDIGTMNKQQGDQYITNYAAQFKSKQQYNQSTGKLHMGQKGIMSIFEDFFVPRKGDQTSQIDTIDDNSQEASLDYIEYLKGKLYKALGIPRTRLDPEATYSMGRAAEITRDELKFHKYTKRLRKKFSRLFIELLKRQLALKDIISEEDFKTIQNLILFDWAKDNYYEELKRLEILSERLNVVNSLQEYVTTGSETKYFTPEFVHREVFDRTEEETKEFMEENPVEPTDEDDI